MTFLVKCRVAHNSERLGMGISELTAILCFVLHRLKDTLESLTARKPVYFFLVYNCLVILHNLFERGFRVAFQWVPAHCGIYGNEKADLTAKEASERGTISNNSPAMCDYNSVARKKLTTSLQKQWHKDKAQTFLGKLKSERQW